MNWDNPISGLAVATLEQAAKEVDFVPFEPKGLGRPRAVFVSSAPQAERRLGPLALVYDSSALGRVVVVEARAALSAEEWVRDVCTRIALAHDAGQTAVKAVFVRGGTVAVLSPAAGATPASLRWLEGLVECILRARDTSDLLAIAEAL